MLKALGHSLRQGWRAAKATYKSVSFSSTSSGGYFDTFRANFAHEGYRSMAKLAVRNPIARRAIDYISTNMASIAENLRVGIDEDGERVDITGDHPWAELQRDPHPQYNFRWFLEGMVWQWMLAGEWWLWPYVREQGPGAGVPARLHLFRERDFNGFETDDRTGMVEGYDLDLPSGENREFPAEEVVHAFNYNPLDSYGTHAGERGLPVLYAAIREIQTQQASSQWNYSIAKSGGRPPVYMMPKGLDAGQQISPEQQERAQESIDEQWREVSEDSKPYVTSGLFEIIEAAISPEDASISDMDQRMQEKVAIGLGIPPIVLGSMEGATFSNLEWAQYIAHTQRILPMLDRFLAELNQGVMPMYAAADDRFEDAYLYYDRRQIDALDVQTAAKADRDATLVQAGIASRDEVRPEHGLEPEGGVSGAQTVSGQIITLDSLAAPSLDEETQDAVQALRGLSEEEFEDRIASVLAGDGAGGGEPALSL